MKPAFDAVAFLRENFHDAPGLIAYLKGNDIEDVPAYDTIYKWFLRGSVPAQWLAIIIGCKESEQEEVGHIRPFIKSA